MALTKVTGQVVNTSTDLTVGVLTATTVSIGGTLTYEDVTNVDSVGLITARNGIEVTDKGVQVGTGATVDSAGDNILTFLTNGSERVRVTSGGNIGIGTASPTAPLAVMSSSDPEIRFGYNETQDHKISWDSSKVFLEADPDNANGSSALGFKVDGTEAARFDSSGRLLVNIDSAMETFGSAALQVATTAGGTLVLGRNDTSVSVDNGLGAIYFDTKAGGSYAESAVIAAEADAAQGSSDYPSRLVFKTTADGASSPTERVRITSAGNFGIGETAPAANLVVKQSGSTFTTASQTVALFQRSSTTGHAAKIAIVGGNAASSDIHFGDTDDEDVGIIHYVHADNSLRFTVNASERMRIDSSGRLLIAQTSSLLSYAGLQIKGDGDTGGHICLAHKTTTPVSGNNIGSVRFTNSAGGIGAIIGVEADANWTAGSSFPTRIIFATTTSSASSPSERMRIDSSGRLMLGTTTEGQGNADNFTIADSGNCGLTIRSGTSSQGNIFFSDGTSGNSEYDGYVQYQQDTQSMLFGTASTERVRIDSSGRLLVGNDSTSNSGLLCVKGSASDSTGGAQMSLQRGQSVSGANQHLGDLNFGEGSANTAQIRAFTNANWSGSSRPTYMTFTTTPSSSGSPTERMRIDSSGRLLVGATATSSSAVGKIVSRNDVDYSSTQFEDNATLCLQNETNSNPAVLLFHANDSGGSSGRAAIVGGNVGGTNSQLGFYGGADNLTTSTNPDVLIDSSGRLVVGKSAAQANTTGAELRDGNSEYAGTFSSSGHVVILANRNTDDGVVIRIRGQGNDEGSISVSGSTVSYNGGHLSRWSQLPGGVERTEILRGSVLSNLDEMCEWGEENNEQLNRMKVSDVEGDRNVSGVFQDWDDDDDTYTNDFYCAMTGDFVIRIAQGTTVARGDLLMSAGDGTAKPQDDDIVRSKTIAKVTSTTVSTTYSDGSYCVPCVLMAC